MAQVHFGHHHIAVKPFQVGIFSLIIISSMFALLSIATIPLSLLSVSPASPSSAIPSTNMTTQGFVDRLQNIGAAPEIIMPVRRNFFSVQGSMVAFADDNIDVFEYPTESAANVDINAFKQSAATKENAWKKNVNLYQKGNLILFYMGTNQMVLQSLQAIAGSPVSFTSTTTTK